MVDRDIKDTIKIIHERLVNNGMTWALVGTTNMRLQGMQVEPRDLDVVIQRKDLKKVSELFSDYSASSVKEFETLSGRPAFEVKATIGDVEVQFFGGDETDIYVSKLLSGRTVSVRLDDIEVPCFMLEAEAQSYVETNRERKADLIREFLRKRRE